MLSFQDMLNESIYEADARKFFAKVNFAKNGKTELPIPSPLDFFISEIVVTVNQEAEEEADQKQVDGEFKKYKFPVQVGQEYDYGKVEIEVVLANGKHASVEYHYYYDSKSKKTLVSTTSSIKRKDTFLIG